MADVLDTANVSWKFYVEAFTGNNADFSGEVWNSFDPIKSVRYGPDWKKNVSTPNTNIFTDIKNRQLPAVSWLIPTLADSDHPASGSNTGPSWVTSVVNAVGQSSYWNNTAIVVVWDDWGGWYDNVPPAQPDYTSLSMRVPLLVISPWAKHGFVSHTEYNFGSMLKFVEQNFGTGTLGTTDASANSIGDVFDYTQTPPHFHPFDAPYDMQFFLRHRPSPIGAVVHGEERRRSGLAPGPDTGARGREGPVPGPVPIGPQSRLTRLARASRLTEREIAQAHGAIVYRLGHRPFKAERRVRFPLALPLKPVTTGFFYCSSPDVYLKDRDRVNCGVSGLLIRAGAEVAGSTND